MLATPLEIVASVARVFERLGIPYLVGGSVASSIYGPPRSTLDADIVANFGPSVVPALVAGLSADFHVDGAMIRTALERRDSFNLIHVATLFKVDIFLQKADPWSRMQMSRSRLESVSTPEGSVTLRFASPEDTLLHKLYWYRLGGGLSDRQWEDVLGILRYQGEALDQSYLDTWADPMGVDDLLRKARADVSGNFS
jgi:hypothetical protein